MVQGSKSISTPVTIRTQEMYKSNFRTELAACFRVGKEQYNFQIPFKYKIENGEVFPQNGSTFLSMELMMNPVFIEFLKKSTNSDFQEECTWRVILDVYSVWENITVFEVFLVLGGVSLIRLGEYCILEPQNGEMNVTLLDDNPLLGYVVPQPKSFKKFKNFLKALVGN